MNFADEIRLIATLVVSGWVWCSAYIFARRRGADAIDSAANAFLIFYLIQYTAVGIAGILGVLYWPMIFALAVGMAAGLWIARPPQTLEPHSERVHPIFFAALCVVCGYCIALIWLQRYAPPLANDSLVYHLPVAVKWIQQHQLMLVPIWLYEPANTYSPLGGSMFITWLMAPLGNDSLARFVQTPALLMLLFASVQLCRNLGANRICAALIALAIVVSRPFIVEATIAKDDLFVIAFFTLAAAELTRDRPRALRVGIAIGLMLATKYTSLMSLPIFLLAIDRELIVHWRWRGWIETIGGPVFIAGPWFLRNWIITGNPIFPIDVSIGSVQIFRGMYHAIPFWQTTPVRMILDLFSKDHFSPPIVLWCLITVVWLCVWLTRSRGILRTRGLRLCVFGPIVGIAIVVFASSYAEARFMAPSIVLLMALVSATPKLLKVMLTAALLVAAISTSFIWAGLVQILPLAAVVSLIGFVICMIARRFPLYTLSVAGAALLIWIYIDWHAYLETYREQTVLAWEQPIYRMGPAWTFANQNVSANQTIAYAGAPNSYPLFGFDLQRKVIFAPSRKDVHAISDLPPIAEPLPAKRISFAFADEACLPFDSETWLSNLHSAGATYFLSAHDANTSHVQDDYASRDAAHFQLLFSDEGASVYKIRDLNQ